MTGVAIRLLVPAIELEFGALVVIEVPRFPRTGVVARFTFLAQPALVDSIVVFLVAGDAVRWRITEQLRLVAFLAFHFHMHAEQWKARPAVIDQRIFPILFIMAGDTALAQLALVHIFFLVARDAIHAQLLLIQITRVARCTFGPVMLALQ